MAQATPPDWAQIAAALYPNLSTGEREALIKIWASNYTRFQPLKAQLNASVDPDLVFDPQP